MGQIGSQLNVYGPLKLSVAYLLFTLFLHIFGPWDYRDEKLLPVLIFMIAAIAMFSLGYFSVARRWRGVIFRNDSAFQLNYSRYLNFAKLSLVVQLLLTLLSFMSDWIDGLLSLSSLFDPGQIYVDAIRRQELESSIVGRIATLASPAFYFSTVFFIFHYSNVSLRWRIVLVQTIVLQLLYGMLLRGAQKAFFDVGIMVAAVIFLTVFYNRGRYIALLRKGLVSLALLLGLFVFFQLSRLDAYGVTYYSGNATMALDRGSVLFEFFGESVGLGLALFVGYLSQGYYGLSLCLQLPFQWTFGVGNSFALMSYIEQYFGVYGVFEGTYPARMEAAFGWPATMYWHTFFPWVASDITFPGSVLLMFVIGRVFAKSMWDGVARGDVLGACVFYFMATLIFYLPANNQLMQTRGMMIGFVVLLAFWMVGGLLSSIHRARTFR